MAGIPTAYITLGDPESNYGENYDDGARTKFSRVAVDPQVGRDWNKKVVRMTALLVTGDVEAKL